MRRYQNMTRCTVRSVVVVLCLVMLGTIAAPIITAPAAAHDKEAPFPLTVAVKAESSEEAERVAHEFGGWVEGELPPGRNLYRVVVPTKVKEKDIQKKTAELADKVKKEHGIFWATPDGSAVEDDRFYAWRFYAWQDGPLLDQADGTDLDDYLNLRSAHQTATGDGVTVAVIDTGFDTDHPMIERQLLPGLDLIDGDTDVSDQLNGHDDDGDGQVDEAYGHGTFVAGIVAQIAPDASILPLRVLDADGVGQVYAVVEAIDVAIELDADVINLSFGMRTKVKAIEEAIKRAKEAGIVVVAAAGNEGSKDKQYPAAGKDVLSVAAFDRSTQTVAQFGSRGKWVDVSAPGVDLVSAKAGGGTGTWSGSSLAAPVVAGQVALIYELSPEKGYKDARKIVRETARKANKKMKDDVGVIDLTETFGRFH